MRVAEKQRRDSVMLMGGCMGGHIAMSQSRGGSCGFVCVFSLLHSEEQDDCLGCVLK